VGSTNGGGDYIVNNQLDPVFYGAYTSGSGFGVWAASTAYALNAVRSANGGFFVCSQAGTSTTGSGPIITAFGTAITDGTAKWLFICSTNSVGVSITATANSNYVTNNDISGPWTAAIFVQNSDGNILTGNTLGQIIGVPIVLGTNATNTLVEGNLISGAYGANSAGIEDTNGSATFSRIFNNEVTNCGWYGIFIQSAGTLVQGNKVSGFGQVTAAYGIGVAGGTQSFGVSGNVILSGSSGCIQVAAGTSDFYSIMGNIVSGGTISDGGTGTHKTLSGNN
jgi:parallel beta-helix repeat protein